MVFLCADGVWMQQNYKRENGKFIPCAWMCKDREQMQCEGFCFFIVLKNVESRPSEFRIQVQAAEYIIRKIGRHIVF